MPGASLPSGATLRFPVSMCCFRINKCNLFQFGKWKKVQSAAKPASVLETLMGNMVEAQLWKAPVQPPREEKKSCETSAFFKMNSQ